MDSVNSSTRADQTLTLLSTAPDHIDEDAMHTHCFTTTADEQYTKADMSGSGTYIAITDRLGLDQDQRHKPFWTTLPEASKICRLPGACLLQL